MQISWLNCASHNRYYYDEYVKANMYRFICTKVILILLFIESVISNPTRGLLADLPKISLNHSERDYIRSFIRNEKNVIPHAVRTTILRNWSEDRYADEDLLYVQAMSAKEVEIERLRKIKQRNDQLYQLSPDQLKAIIDYTQNSYADINQALRIHDGDIAQITDDSIRTQARNIDHAIRRINSVKPPADITLYRRQDIKKSTFRYLCLQQQVVEIKKTPQKTSNMIIRPQDIINIRFNSFISTSKRLSMAQSWPASPFRDNSIMLVRFEIHNPYGFGADISDLSMYISDLSDPDASTNGDYQREDEVLLLPTSYFVVKDIAKFSSTEPPLITLQYTSQDDMVNLPYIALNRGYEEGFKIAIPINKDELRALQNGARDRMQFYDIEFDKTWIGERLLLNNQMIWSFMYLHYHAGFSFIRVIRQEHFNLDVDFWGDAKHQKHLVFGEWRMIFQDNGHVRIQNYNELRHNIKIVAAEGEWSLAKVKGVEPSANWRLDFIKTTNCGVPNRYRNCDFVLDDDAGIISFA